MPNPNTYTGTTNLNAGTVTLDSASGFGPSTNPLVITGLGAAANTVLQGTAAVTFAGNAVTLNNADVSFNGSVPITFAGTTTLVGSNTLTISDTAGTFFNGQVTGSGGLILARGRRPLILSAGRRQQLYRRNVDQHRRRCPWSPATAMPSEPITAAISLPSLAGIVDANVNALTLNQTVFLNGAGTFTGSQNITFTGAATITAATMAFTVNNPVTTFSGVIGEAGGARILSLAGLGTLALDAANTYAGGTTINNDTAGIGSGILSINTGSTLGSPTSANPLYSSSIGSGLLTFTSGVLQNAGGVATASVTSASGYASAPTVTFVPHRRGRAGSPRREL